MATSPNPSGSNYYNNYYNNNNNGNNNSNNGNNNGLMVIAPTAVKSPTASESRRRRRYNSRLMSNVSSVVSAAAAGIPDADKHKISNNEALLHMVKATIGGGFLAIPEAFHNAGLLVGSIGMLILGVSVLNMMASIVRCSQTLRSGKYADAVLADRKKNDTVVKDEIDDYYNNLRPIQKIKKQLILPPMDYPDTVAAVFRYGARGRFAHWESFTRNFTSASLVTTYYGVNIVYVCIVAGTMKQLVDQYTAQAPEDSWVSSVHNRSIRWYPALAGLLIIPVGMVRLIKYLVPFSIAANVCLISGACAVFYFIFTGDGGQNPLGPEERAKLIVWPVTQWTLFAGSALCSLEGVGMLLHIENAMRQPLELAGPPSYTIHRAMVIIIAMNTSLGLFGYMRFGDRCLGSVSLNLPKDDKLSEAVKVLIALGILLTYGLQLTVTADLAWQGLRSKLTKITEADAADGGNKTTDESSPRMLSYYYVMRFSLILGTILVATAVPDIGPLISLVGSVGFSVLGLIVPVFMETVWFWYPEDEDEDQDGEPSCYWSRGGEPETSVGNSSASTAIGEGPPTVAVEAEKKKTVHCRHRVRRIMRHLKNVVIFALAVTALIGGTFYNVQDIVARATGDDTSASS